MTDAKSRSHDRAIEYLARLLQMNPVYEGDQIVRARSRALRLGDTPQTSATDPAEDFRKRRRQLLARLEQIRAQFWTLPPAELRAALEAIDASGAPDIEAAALRLRTVAAERGNFPKISQMPGFDGEFFSHLKQVVINAPRDVAVLKEQVLSSFRNRKHRKRLRRMVELLKQEMPAIYELEADWFDALYRQKAKSRPILVSSTAPLARPSFGGYGWLIWIGLILLIRLLAALGER